MMDLTRLMFDDGASLPAEEEHEDYPAVLFQCGGKLWEGVRWLPGDYWYGRGWTFTVPDGFYPIKSFLDNPAAYAERFWPDGDPGWRRDDPREPSNNDVVYTFREV